MLLEDFKRAVVIDPREFDDKPFYWWLGVRLAYLVAPVL
jgi:hypothetical protein